MLIAAVLHAPVHALTVSDENRVKAAFVFNFIKFVEWPDTSFASSGSPLYVCVWGDKANSDALKVLDQKTAKQRQLKVIAVHEASGLTKCHVLFLTRKSRDTFKTILRSIAGKSILTVSDIGEFAQSGGLIGLFKADDQMRFAINVDATQRAGLRMSSQLLKFGRIVSGGGD